MIAKRPFLIHGLCVSADFPLRASARLTVNKATYLEMAVIFPESATRNGPVYYPLELRTPILVETGQRVNVSVTFHDEHKITKDSHLTVNLF